MKLKLLLSAILIIIGLPVSAQCTGVFTIFTEDFEDHGNTANGGAGRYTSASDFFGGASDYFGRINANEDFYLTNSTSGNNIAVLTPYLGQNGSYFFAGEDLNDAGPLEGIQDGNPFKEISFTGVNIAGATNMCFSGLFAIGQTNPCGSSNYDSTDYIKVYYTLDGGVEVEALCFYADLECNIPADITNEPLYYDPNCDGDGGEGTLLTNTFAEFTFNVAGTGNVLDLRVEVRMDAGSEEVALDYLRIRSDTEVLGIPEQTLETTVLIYPNPSTGLFELKVSDAMVLRHASIYNILGENIKAFDLANMSGSKILDLTELSSGVYFIKINNHRGESITKKLIIN